MAGRVIEKIQCEYCSKNNLNVFEDGGMYCFTPNCEYNRKRPKISSTMPTKPLIGEYLPTRGLSASTCVFYNYQVSKSVSGIVAICNYGTAQKIKYPDKKMKWENYSSTVHLYGMQCFTEKDCDLPLIITEGEEDAMSVYQALSVPSVSIQGGAGNALSNIKADIDYVNSFERVILLFDNDVHGQNAIKQIKGSGLIKNLYVATIDGWKDANEALQNGDLEAIKIAIDNAKEQIPEGIVFGDQLNLEEFLIPEPRGYSIPFPLLDKSIRGLKGGRVCLVGAGTGVGKSTLMREIVYSLLTEYNNIKIANIFLEERTKYTALSLLAIHANIPAFMLRESPDRAMIEKGFPLINKSRVAFFDHFGSLDKKAFLAKLEWLVGNKQFNVVILDHISIIVSGTEGSQEGERKDIDILMTRLKAIAERYNTVILVVSHLNRPKSEGGYEEGRAITLNSFRGSGSLTHLSDIVIGLESNKYNELEKNSVDIRLLKNRETGEIGIADKLFFSPSTGRLKALGTS